MNSGSFHHFSENVWGIKKEKKKERKSEQLLSINSLQANSWSEPPRHHPTLRAGKNRYKKLIRS